MKFIDVLRIFFSDVSVYLISKERTAFNFLKPLNPWQISQFYLTNQKNLLLFKITIIHYYRFIYVSAYKQAQNGKH